MRKKKKTFPVNQLLTLDYLLLGKIINKNDQIHKGEFNIFVFRQVLDEDNGINWSVLRDSLLKYNIINFKIFFAEERVKLK